MSKAHNKKNYLPYIIIPVAAIVISVAVYIFFFMPIDINHCDSPCDFGPIKGSISIEDIHDCPTVCAQSYTTIWRKINDQPRIKDKHY